MQAIKLANDCPFGLGSNVFSTNARRANAIARQLQAGMSSINDFATTYMCQVTLSHPLLLLRCALRCQLVPSTCGTVILGVLQGSGMIPKLPHFAHG